MAYDPFPLQVIASGFTDGAHAGLTTTALGVAVAATGAGVYTLTLDPAAQGDVGISAAALRVSITLLGNSGIIQYVRTSASVITVSSFAVDGTTATDKAFSFIVYRVPGA